MEKEGIRSGEKNFEQEKAKMLEIPTSDMQEAKKGLTKEKQLEIAFKSILNKNGVMVLRNFMQSYNMDNIVKELLKEVKIRVKL